MMFKLWVLNCLIAYVVGMVITEEQLNPLTIGYLLASAITTFGLFVYLLAA